jgi:hypothetical protein
MTTTWASTEEPQPRQAEVIEALKWLIDYKGIEKNILRGTKIPHQTFLPSASSAHSTTRLIRSTSTRPRHC